MIDVYLCCGASQREVVACLQARLEQTAEARVRVEVCDAEQTVLELWDEGLAGHAIVLLLSADVVPARSDRAAWEPVLQHVGGHIEPAVGVVVMMPCKYPKLLERAGFFHGDGLPAEVMRQLQAWLVALHPQPSRPLFEPSALPVAAEEEPALDDLWRRMVDGSGEATVADSQMAQKLARRALPYFREVLWLDCAGRATACLAGELAWGLGVRLEGTEAEAWRRLSEFLGKHRVLVVLDEAPESIPELAPEGGRGCVVRTMVQPRSVQPAEVQRRRAEMLNEIFLEWRDVERCRRFVAELEPALEWARANDWALAVSLTNRAGNYLKLSERRFEAVYLFERLSEEAGVRGEAKVESDCRWELSWLRHEAGEVRAAWESREQMSLFGDGGL